MRKRPGEVRDAIVSVLTARPGGASVAEIIVGVESLIGKAAPSSVRSYLNLNTPDLFQRSARGSYSLQESALGQRPHGKKKVKH